MIDALTAGVMLASFALIACRARWSSALWAIGMALVAGAIVLSTIDPPAALISALNLFAFLITALCAGLLLGGVQLGDKQLASAAIVCGAIAGALLHDGSPEAVWGVSAASISVVALGKLLIARGRMIALKVLASWLLAAAVLSAASIALPPQQAADHME